MAIASPDPTGPNAAARPFADPLADSFVEARFPRDRDTSRCALSISKKRTALQKLACDGPSD
jgi:hypothetical protein